MHASIYLIFPYQHPPTLLFPSSYWYCLLLLLLLRLPLLLLLLPQVVLYWKGTGLLMVGPYGDFLHYYYKEPLTLVTEVDCCRIGEELLGAMVMVCYYPPPFPTTSVYLKHRSHVTNLSASL